MANLARRFRHHLKESVLIYPYIRTNHRGEQMYGDPVEHLAFVSYQLRKLEFPSGDTRISNARVYIMSDTAAAKAGDQVELNDGQKLRIITISRWSTAPWIVLEV